MTHKILPTGLHAITRNGIVEIYTENEYSQLSWWQAIKIKYDL